MDTTKYDGDVRWIPVTQAARELRVSTQRVYQLIGRGALTAIRINTTVLVGQRSVEARIALLLSERR